MKKFGRIQLLGVGVLTPSLVGQPYAAEARPADFTEPLKLQAANASTARLVETFKRELFALTPAEKISIAGDRIRLSAQQLSSKKAPVVSEEGTITYQDGCGGGSPGSFSCGGNHQKMENNLNKQHLVTVGPNCAGSGIKSGTQIKR